MVKVSLPFPFSHTHAYKPYLPFYLGCWRIMGDIQCWVSPGAGGTQKQKATVTLSHFSRVRLLLFPLHWSIAVIDTLYYINKIIMWI